MYKILFPVSDKKISANLVTQPNQSFTPRQILEQFARGEVIPCEYHDSDNIDDAHFSEEQLISDDVIEFEDRIDAENHLIENQYARVGNKTAPKSEKDQGKPSSFESDKGSPAEADE